MKKKLRGMKRRAIQLDYDLYRVQVPIQGQLDMALSVIDLWPAEVEQTLMFVHGYAGCAETWEYQINHFAREYFVGAVARSQLHVGEPVVETEIVMPGSRGFLAAVLRPGLRAVSVPATATSTVSGFIYAGDRVDVLLTHVLNGANGQHSATETILRNARVIAMDQKLDFAPGDKPDVAKTATLELTAKQTEIVTLAVKMGDLSLVLRSLQDSEEEERDLASGDDATAELGDSYTHDTQVSRLIKDPTPPAKPPEVVKPSVFVLRGSARIKQELDGSVVVDPTAPPAEPEAAKPNASKTTTLPRTIASVPQ